MGNIKALQSELRKLADPEKAKILQRFFKTGKGQYGEGDVFLGIMVPQQRLVAKRHVDLPLADVERLLHSRFHEERMVALFILVQKFNRADEKLPGQIVKLYLKNTAYINNWDLIDLSAPLTVGRYLESKPKAILYKLAKSKSLWERRIAIMSTFWFIKQRQFEDSLRIAELLLKDSHDLIHKAVGWMLREVGNRSRETEERFLKLHYRTMPRTMLRYAIEKFPEPLRKRYLQGTI